MLAIFRKNSACFLSRAKAPPHGSKPPSAWPEQWRPPCARRYGQLRGEAAVHIHKESSCEKRRCRCVQLVCAACMCAGETQNIYGVCPPSPTNFARAVSSCACVRPIPPIPTPFPPPYILQYRLHMIRLTGAIHSCHIIILFRDSIRKARFQRYFFPFRVLYGQSTSLTRLAYILYETHTYLSSSLVCDGKACSVF